MKVFGEEYLTSLTALAQISPRKRQHCNIHESYSDPCQRLFNAIELNSYIRPHRHATDPRDELLIAVRGSMLLVTFDEHGMTNEFLRFGDRKNSQNFAVGVEVSAVTWHTVVALEPSSVLLEVKAGPFDASQPKDLAPWAPDEGTSAAQAYLAELIECANKAAKGKS
jgi:cupin fold WbuC family metalloprotein